MGLFSFLGFEKKEKSAGDSIYDVEPAALRAQVDGIYNRIKRAREQKNKLPAGKTLLNQLELIQVREPETYRVMINVVLPEMSKLNNDIKTLLVRIGDTKTEITVPQNLLDFLNNARMEFEQDVRLAENISKPISDRKLKRVVDRPRKVA